jgi:hypothetical protein
MNDHFFLCTRPWLSVLLRLMAARSPTGCRRRGLSLTVLTHPALSTEASSSCPSVAARCIPGGGSLLLSGGSPANSIRACRRGASGVYARWRRLPLRARWRQPPPRASLARWRGEILLASTLEMLAGDVLPCASSGSSSRARAR